MDENKITVEMIFESGKGYDRSVEYSIADKNVDYLEVGRRRYICFKREFLLNVLESQGVKEDTKIIFEIEYPVK